MKASYNWLKEYVDGTLPAPKELGDILTLGAFQVEGVEQIGDDYVIDIDVQPNRAHDCFCQYGIACEAAILSGNKFKEYVADGTREDFKTEMKVEIQDDMCTRFIAREIKNVKVGPSSDAIKKKLEALGQRSINNIVDITNLVMFEIGRPTHVFDKDKMSGNSIFIRKSKDGEKITTLDKKEVTFTGTEVVVADDAQALSIAGIKGGNAAEVGNETVNVVLEVANWDSAKIRFTRRKIGIETDSSKRFERQISAVLAETGMRRLTDLIIEHASTPETKVSNMVDIYPNPVENWTVSVSTEGVNKHLGTEFADNDIENIFNKLTFSYTKDGGMFTVNIPPTRLDLKIKEDLIEEIARVYGYANIQSRPVERGGVSRVMNKEYFYATKIFDFLINHGYSEVMNYVLRDEGEVELANPLASDKRFMRKSLTGGMKQSLELNTHNIDLLGLEEIKTFEIGKTFDVAGEYTSVAIAYFNPKLKKAANDEVVNALIKELSEMLGVEIKASVSDQSIVEFKLEDILEKLPEPTDSYLLDLNLAQGPYKSFPLYPFILRDIAVWVPEAVSKDELLEVIKENTGELLVKDRLFDEFKKDGRVSYAYRLVFQSFEKTLTDDEINPIMEKVSAAIAEKGWEVR